MSMTGDPMPRLPNAIFVSACSCFALILGLALASPRASAQALAPVCHPAVSGPVVVETHDQIIAAGLRAVPPITDTGGFGFAWPDTPLGVIKTSDGYEFFGSDGGAHYRQMRQGHWVGNNKSGSFTTTVGTLDNPLGKGDPHDVSVSPNPNPSVNPIYPSYGYMGGGPVYQVPAGMTGASNLLATYHAELPNDALYAALGLAASTDNGLHWTDLGEIIRLNQAYAVGLDGFEIGDGPLVLSPDGKYFYLYFPDWIANGSLHTTNAQGESTTTNVSVARALATDVLDTAFGPAPHHSIAFQKFYEGNWHLQPAIGGASTDLNPHAPYSGYLDIHYNSALQRYGMIISDDTNFAYAESTDGLAWTHTLGKSFYVYFTYLPTDGSGWTNGSLRRLTLTCQ
jgi:hypothetical protein